MASDDSDSDSETKLKTTVLTHLPTKPQIEAILKPKPSTGQPTPTFHDLITTLTLHQIILIALPVLSLLGLYGTWTLGYSNGLFKSIVALIEDPDAKFPGTDQSLSKRYTGLGFIDHQLAILVTFFAPVCDFGYGREGLALFSVFGLGQFGSAWTLMVMESLRVGNKGLTLSFIGTVGFIFQNISFTVTTPLWLLLHLLTSPVAKSFPGTNANGVLLIHTWDLRVLPFSIAISYILPSLLMGLPFSSGTHQAWIAIWQAFPLWTVITHYLLRTAAERISERVWKIDPKTRTTIPPGASYLNNAECVYQSVIGLCMATHIPVLLIAILPSWIFPSTMLTRMGKETISSIFVPSFPSLHHKISGLAEGAHIFLHWDLYIGSTALLLWAVLLYQNATTEKATVDPTSSLPVYRELSTGEKPKKDNREKATRKLVLKMIGWSLASGPMGLVAMLLWQRDTIVRQKIKQGV